MRMVLYFRVSSASVAGNSDRRWVAITVQPRAAYCFVNSSPIPELAPVISTVWACATAGPISDRTTRVMAANRCRACATAVASSIPVQLLRSRRRRGGVDVVAPGGLVLVGRIRGGMKDNGAGRCGRRPQNRPFRGAGFGECGTVLPLIGVLNLARLDLDPFFFTRARRQR